MRSKEPNTESVEGLRFAHAVEPAVRAQGRASPALSGLPASVHDSPDRLGMPALDALLRDAALQHERPAREGGVP